MAKPLPIAVLISGGGTTLRNLMELKSAGQLPVEFKLVISSNPQAKGLVYAVQAGILTLVAEKARGTTTEAYSHAVFDPIRASLQRITGRIAYLCPHCCRL